MLTFSAKQHRLNRFVLGVASFVVVAPEGQTVDDVDKLIEKWKKETGYDEFRKTCIKCDVEFKPDFNPPPPQICRCGRTTPRKIPRMC